MTKHLYLNGCAHYPVERSVEAGTCCKQSAPYKQMFAGNQWVCLACRAHDFEGRFYTAEQWANHIKSEEGR